MVSILKTILTDIKVELADEFDRNFERKAFFNTKWAGTKHPNNRGSLMVRTSRLRRSIRGVVGSRGVTFCSDAPYAQIHNEGGNVVEYVKAHHRTHYKSGKRHQVRSFSRKIRMPKRQFIGEHKVVEQAIGRICTKHIKARLNLIFSNIKK